MPVDTYKVGRFFVRAFRDCLRVARTLGYDVECDESRGWLGSTFTLSGPQETLNILQMALTANFPRHSRDER